jgi:hypothetical protein
LPGLLAAACTGMDGISPIDSIVGVSSAIAWGADWSDGSCANA